MPAESRGRAKPKAKVARRAPPAMAYLALHGSDLGRALAAGAITARSSDQRLWAPLSMVGSDGLGGLVDRAWQGRDYGVVALVEIPLGQLGLAGSGDAIRAAHLAPSYVPLALLSRIIFRSTGDLDEFRARSSGYEDVPADMVAYDVEPALFEVAAGGLLPGPAIDRVDGESKSFPGLAEVRTIDKLAGAISACLAVARQLPEDARFERDLQEACAKGGGAEAASAFVRAMALQLDASADCAVNANLLARAAATLATVEPSAGFDGELFLANFAGMFEQGSEEEALARKFATSASAIFSGNQEVADDGFADRPGKTMLRGLLLFLLNPDAARLQSVGKRLGILGPSVRMLASSLAGCLSGFSAMPASLKAPGRDCYLAVPLLALRMSDGGFDGLDAVQCWGEDATGELVLSFEGRAIMTRKLAAPHGFPQLRALLASLGNVVAVDPDNGFLVWHDPELPGARLQARHCVTPVFPPREGIEISVTLENKLPRRDLLAYVARVNGTAMASGVFGTALGQGRKLVLQLGVVCDSFEHGAISRAVLALASEAASFSNREAG